ncbi:hypothetical protein [Aeoliella mucimassa]|uniref:Uncharacterized protein n=1 Tax=Aeoliella mucimassa TaxID=2527972 RepID=A0A518AGP7_9BACT|nr:hypothetical protein [Aeoliella mucimassa]QDU53884.1 hypothetical protein Pan181_00620 [Aeoliella mucimassa]
MTFRVTTLFYLIALVSLSIVAFGTFGIVVAGVLIWSALAMQDEWVGYLIFGLIFVGCSGYSIVLDHHSQFVAQWLSNDPLLVGNTFKQAYGLVLLTLLIVAVVLRPVRRRIWPLFGPPAPKHQSPASRIKASSESEPEP